MVDQELAISFRSEQSSLTRENPGVALRASKEVDSSSHLKRRPFMKKGSRLAPQASKKGRRVLEQRRTPSTRVEDFVPWVSPISSLSPANKEEDEEDEMVDLIHNFGARKHKRGASFERMTDVTPKFMGEADRHSTGGGSEKQLIVVMDSPEMDFHGQPAVETTHVADLEEVLVTHEEAQGRVPLE